MNDVPSTEAPFQSCTDYSKSTEFEIIFVVKKLFYTFRYWCVIRNE